ncbi:uncharacterized protein PHALS_11439 [Plasmopara halstedii]|uniref:Uncharacterized protein n=1 Tax=Plasmopara halstedii TaxID=4781 RepID=A0A0P1A4U9_PLAHL|nr:uncharacterized protein PHALS_11439 [Plasmopara halstedii]CEG35565.1 hypothetical protein PHALS_11439 [Plasmopara halstedii]|eukprot:XP_024571934.1 hypothetical protein PHALS_11439 [Plasmopara halstedii]
MAKDIPVYRRNVTRMSSSIPNEVLTSSSANPKFILYGTSKTHYKACLVEADEEKESDIDGTSLRYEPQLHDENSVIITSYKYDTSRNIT